MLRPVGPEPERSSGTAWASTTPCPGPAATARTQRDGSPDTEIAFLARALKAPSLRDSADRLAARAREESWIHQEYLASQTRVLDKRDANYYYKSTL